MYIKNNINQQDFNVPFKVFVFTLPLFIFTGYALRGIVSYNFEIIFAFVSIALITLFFLKKRLNSCPSLWWFTIVLLLYFFSVLLPSLMLHDGGSQSSHKLAILILIPGFILLAWLLYQAKLKVDFFWYFLMLASSVMLIWALLEVNAVGVHSLGKEYRLGDFYSHPIKLGVYANALFILMLGGILWAYKKHPLLLAAWICFLLLDFLMVILSQTRTAWIGWPEALIGWGTYYLFLIWKSNWNSLSKVFVMIVPVLILVGISLTEPVSNVFEKRVQLAVDNVSDYFSGENYQSSLGARLMMYETAIEMIQKKPLVGYGAEDFAKQFKLTSIEKVKERFGVDFSGFDYGHVHNQFLMSWVQYGVMAFVSLLLVFIFLFYHFVVGMRSSKDEDKPIFIAGLVFSVAAFLGFMPESPLEFSGYSAHYLLFFSLLFSFSLSVKRLNGDDFKIKS